MAVDWAEVAIFISPLIPNRDPVVLEILDIRIPRYEPQKLIDYGFKVHLFGGQKRETLAQIKPHLVAEYALRAHPSAVSLESPLGANATQ